MPPTFWLAWLVRVAVLTAVAVVVAFLAIVLAAFAVAALVVAVVLHKLGWDRRLLDRLKRAGVVRVETFGFPRKPEVDDMDAPIEARWTMVEERRPV